MLISVFRARLGHSTTKTSWAVITHSNAVCGCAYVVCRDKAPRHHAKCGAVRLPSSPYDFPGAVSFIAQWGASLIRNRQTAMAVHALTTTWSSTQVDISRPTQ